MRSIVIAEKEISDETEPFVIAEIGHNHQGSLATCLQMIQAAASVIGTLAGKNTSIARDEDYQTVLTFTCRAN